MNFKKLDLDFLENATRAPETSLLIVALLFLTVICLAAITATFEFTLATLQMSAKQSRSKDTTRTVNGFALNPVEHGLTAKS
jgi:hypothetical protein